MYYHNMKLSTAIYAKLRAHNQLRWMRGALSYRP